ncbi:hypothetical protein AAYO93_10150 [Diaminobutyricibacter sp. McL0608]
MTHRTAVVDDALGSPPVADLDEPRTTPSGRRHGIDGRDDHCGRLRVEETAEPPHPVDLGTDAEESLLTQHLLPLRNALSVERVTRRGSHTRDCVRVGAP